MNYICKASVFYRSLKKRKNHMSDIEFQAKECPNIGMSEQSDIMVLLINFVLKLLILNTS